MVVEDGAGSDRISLTLCLVMVAAKPGAVFYLLPTPCLGTGHRLMERFLVDWRRLCSFVAGAVLAFAGHFLVDAVLSPLAGVSPAWMRDRMHRHGGCYPTLSSRWLTGFRQFAGWRAWAICLLALSGPLADAGFAANAW